MITQIKKDSLKTVNIRIVKITNVTKGVIYHFFKMKYPITDAISTNKGQKKRTRTNSDIISPPLNDRFPSLTLEQQQHSFKKGTLY